MSGPIMFPRLVPLVVVLILVGGSLYSTSPSSAASGNRAADPFAEDSVAASIRQSLGAQSQTGTGEPAIGRSSYESPLGFMLDWGSGWDLDRNTAVYGLDLAVFENDDDLSLQVWGFMNFGGDPDVCLEQMEGFYPQVFDIDDLTPLRNGVDDPIGPGDDIAYGAFEYTETPRDEAGQRLYLSCETLTPGESVIVVGVSSTGADFEDSLAAADTFLDDSLTIETQTLDLEGFSDRSDTISGDIDRFYRRSLRIEDVNEYVSPIYETFSEPTDSPCYSTPLDGSAPDRNDSIRYPGVGPAYCGSDQRILIDAPWMLTYILPQAGDVSLATILAHESGHHLQGLTGWNRGFDYGDPKDTFIAEQQADCLSGSYVRSTVLRGIYPESDVEEILALLANIGGFEAGVDHGTGEERIDAFNLGYDDGFDACGLYDRRD